MLQFCFLWLKRVAANLDDFLNGFIYIFHLKFVPQRQNDKANFQLVTAHALSRVLHGVCIYGCVNMITGVCCRKNCVAIKVKGILHSQVVTPKLPN